ncbi:MAG: hypothetical protein R2877_00365 [Bdellovibrionota bacterium]
MSSSKEYDTLQPIPSQAERDLSFLDASMEVADFSSSKHLKTTKKLRKRPWFGYKMNLAGRAGQALVIAAISIAGFTFGLWVLGIPIKSANIFLLFRYGYTGSNEGVQIVKYNGALLDAPDNQNFFKVRGLIFNFEREFLPPSDFILSIYSQDKKLMDKFQFSCCKKEFYPRKITQMEETFPISSNQVGYFELKTVPLK